MQEKLKGAVVGVFVTTILYFIPGLNFFGPIIGGFIGGYIAAAGFVGGLGVGILMGVIMILPGLILSGALAAAFHNVPVLGALVGGLGAAITIILVAHTAAFGIVGAAIGGMLGNKD